MQRTVHEKEGGEIDLLALGRDGNIDDRGLLRFLPLENKSTLVETLPLGQTRPWRTLTRLLLLLTTHSKLIYIFHYSANKQQRSTVLSLSSKIASATRF
jgi:hypothetical protein